MTSEVAVNEQPLVQSFTNIHTALRTDLKALDSAIKRKGRLNKQNLERVNRWFEFYWSQLVSHHTGEDTYFYPAIGKFDPKFIPEIEKLTGQHHQMDHLADDLKTTYSRASQLQDSPELEGVARHYTELISALYVTLDSHLTHEEGILFPSIAYNMPLHDQVNIDQAYIKKVPMKELVLLAPWLLANMTAEQGAEMRGKVPWFIRFLNDYFWNRKYKALVATFQI